MGASGGSATFVEATNDLHRAPITSDAGSNGRGAGGVATTTTAVDVAEAAVDTAPTADQPPIRSSAPGSGPTLEEALAPGGPTTPPVPNLGDPETAGWTGVTGVARYSDGSTKPICVLLSDGNGSHTSVQVTPGVPFSIAFPARPSVGTWIGACDEGPHSGGIHTELSPTITVRADGPTAVDWTVTRNEITVDLLVVTADSRPVPGICANIGNETYRTDANGRVVVPGVHLSVAAVQVGYGCPEGGNWLSGLDHLTFFTGEPETVVRRQITLDGDPTDAFATASAATGDSVIEFVRTTTQPGEPTPSCALGPLTGSTWHGPLSGWVSAFLRPISGDGDTLIAVWEGTSLGDLREVACVRSPAGFPFHSLPPNTAGLSRYVQYADTGSPDVAGFTFYDD